MADGQVTWTGYGTFPSLNPGQTYNAEVNATITTFVNELHELRAFNDGQNNSFQYMLQPGSCRRQPAARPAIRQNQSALAKASAATPKAGASM